MAFFSFCTALILLGYVSFLFGVGVLTPTERRIKAILFTGLSFAMGFSIIFAYELLPSPAQLFLVDAFHSIAKVAGAVAIAIGLLFISQSGDAKARETSWSATNMGTRAWSAAGFGFGALLAAVWPYCVGPILSAAISLSLAPSSAPRGQYLLIIYVLGLAVAFGVSATALSRLLSTLLARVEPEIKRRLLLAAGVIQTALGVSLVFTDLWLSLNRVLIRLASNSPQARLEDFLSRLLG